MTDDDQTVDEDLLAELLRRVGDDPTLTPQNRDRARTAMFAEFDAIVAGEPSAELQLAVRAMPNVGLGEEQVHSSRRSAMSRWSVAAAACLIVLALAVVSNLRRESSSSDAIDPPVPTLPDTIPAVEEPPDMLSATLLPVALGDETYRTDAIRGGLSFSGADGLQLVELRPGLVVLDDISADGDVRGRVSVFAADPTVVEGVVSAAVEDGYLQATGALFTGSGEALSRQDLTVTGDGLADLACVTQSACIPLGDDEGLFDPSVWARSENFLVEASPGAPAIFVLVQTKGFGDPLLSQSFEIIDSLRLG